MKLLTKSFCLLMTCMFFILTVLFISGDFNKQPLKSEKMCISLLQDNNENQYYEITNYSKQQADVYKSITCLNNRDSYLTILENLNEEEAEFADRILVYNLADAYCKNSIEKTNSSLLDSALDYPPDSVRTFENNTMNAIPYWDKNFVLDGQIFVYTNRVRYGIDNHIVEANCKFRNASGGNINSLQRGTDMLALAWNTSDAALNTDPALAKKYNIGNACGRNSKGNTITNPSTVTYQGQQVQFSMKLPASGYELTLIGRAMLQSRTSAGYNLQIAYAHKETELTSGISISGSGVGVSFSSTGKYYQYFSLPVHIPA